MKKTDFFNIPYKHIENITEIKYRFLSEQLSVSFEECAELIQAISKYNRWIESSDLENRDAFEHIRAHIVEETTHVAIALGMLQKIFHITQEEINAEVKRKALEANFDLSEYPESFRDDAS